MYLTSSVPNKVDVSDIAPEPVDEVHEILAPLKVSLLKVNLRLFPVY